MKPIVLLVLAFLAIPSAFAANDQPNIVFLLADDMGYGDLGCYGSPIIQSPNIDKLAAQGVMLNQCYAASSNCSPSRTGMLTGRSPYRVGMYDFARFKPLHIPVSETTIAEQLKLGGYQTMFAGKWHCSGDFESGAQPYPGDHGFDHWLANATNFGKDPKTFHRNGEPAGQIDGWMSELVVDETMSWLDGRDTDKPFFTCLWFSEPQTTAPNIVRPPHSAVLVTYAAPRATCTKAVSTFQGSCVGLGKSKPPQAAKFRSTAPTGCQVSVPRPTSNRLAKTC